MELIETRCPPDPLPVRSAVEDCIWMRHRDLDQLQEDFDFDDLAREFRARFVVEDKEEPDSWCRLDITVSDCQEFAQDYMDMLIDCLLDFDDNAAGALVSVARKLLYNPGWPRWVSSGNRKGNITYEGYRRVSGAIYDVYVKESAIHLVLNMDVPVDLAARIEVPLEQPARAVYTYVDANFEAWIIVTIHADYSRVLEDSPSKRAHAVVRHIWETIGYWNMSTLAPWEPKFDRRRGNDVSPFTLDPEPRGEPEKTPVVIGGEEENADTETGWDQTAESSEYLSESILMDMDSGSEFEVVVVNAVSHLENQLAETNLNSDAEPAEAENAQKVVDEPDGREDSQSGNQSIMSGC